MVIHGRLPDHTSTWTVLTLLGRNLLTICVIGGGSLALIHVAHHSAHGVREIESKNDADGWVITRTELIHLWLPGTLIELSERQRGPSPMRTHEELQGILEARRQRDLWYGRTVRVHKVNGEFSDVTYIRWPYSDSFHFPELIDILAVAAGGPSGDPAFTDSNPQVIVLPDRLLHLEPREVIGDVLATIPDQHK